MRRVATQALARYLVRVMASKTKSKVVDKAAKKTGAKAKGGRAAKGGKAGKAARTPAIDDPAQRVLARHIPRLCEVFGFPQARLTQRAPSAGPVEFVQNSLREVALGSVVWLGRELGITWSRLHDRNNKHGTTEIAELKGAHRFSLGLFATRFGALTGLGDDPETGRPLPGPVGQVGAFVRQAYELVRADALRDLSEAVPL